MSLHYSRKITELSTHSNACEARVSLSLNLVYHTTIMPSKVTTENEDDDPVVTGITLTSTNTKSSGPGTLRQRFKLTVDDISKEVEELSVKLKRKVC